MSDQTIIKKLLYRSTHRGCKETDFLIGEFAKENLKKMSEAEIAIFADFLEEDDLKIYDWVLDKSEVPPRYLDVIKGVRGFCGV